MTKIKLKDWPKYWPGKLDPAQTNPDNFYREVNDNTLHIGQFADNNAARVLECTICGGRDFNVGQASCFTAIRCTTCEWEACVHDG